MTADQPAEATQRHAAPVGDEVGRIVDLLREAIRGEVDGTTIPVPVEDCRALVNYLTAPVAVDEATVARVLGWAAETADTLGGHLTGHELRILADDPAEVVRALAARNEDGSDRPRPARDDDYGQGAAQ